MTTQPIRMKEDYARFCAYFEDRGEYRNLLLVVFGVHTALRISDMLTLRWSSVFDFERNRFRKEIELSEGKTKKTRIILLNRKLVDALELHKNHCAPTPDGFIFESRKTNADGTSRAISRVQAHRILRGASDAIGLEPRVSCHSLRKTFGYHAWKSGVSPAIIMEIYNHSSFAVTRRYLGITQDELNEVYKKFKIGG